MNRYKGIVREFDRVLYLASHTLLRALAHISTGLSIDEWSLRYTLTGQPYLTHPSSKCPLHATLTHTNGLVAAGISRSPIGVDAEATLMDGTIAEELSYRYFTKREHLYIQSHQVSDRTARFLEIWSLKEAYLKAWGSGLSGGLTSTCFAEFKNGLFHAIKTSASTKDISPRVSLYRINDYHLSVCSLSGSNARVHRMTFSNGRWSTTSPYKVTKVATASGRWGSEFFQSSFEAAQSTYTGRQNQIAV